MALKVQLVEAILVLEHYFLLARMGYQSRDK